MVRRPLPKTLSRQFFCAGNNKKMQEIDRAARRGPLSHISPERQPRFGFEYAILGT